jgi:hypothetical protein
VSVVVCVGFIAFVRFLEQSTFLALGLTARFGARLGARFGAGHGTRLGDRFGARHGTRLGASFGAGHVTRFGARLGARFSTGLKLGATIVLHSVP